MPYGKSADGESGVEIKIRGIYYLYLQQSKFYDNRADNTFLLLANRF